VAKDDSLKKWQLVEKKCDEGVNISLHKCILPQIQVGKVSSTKKLKFRFKSTIRLRCLPDSQTFGELIAVEFYIPNT
jgi:hypothetical protein